MAKLGDPYQQLVGAVESALDPGAEVEVGAWTEGPRTNLGLTLFTLWM